MKERERERERERKREREREEREGWREVRRQHDAYTKHNFDERNKSKMRHFIDRNQAKQYTCAPNAM